MVNADRNKSGVPAEPPTASLAEVLATPELALRPSRPADFAAENRALVALATALVESPANILQGLVEYARELCGGDSAGISILEGEGPGAVFRWHAVAGAWVDRVRDVQPRSGSPCGAALDRDSCLLMVAPARHFAAMRAVQPPAVEALLAPFHRGKRPVGTVWVVTHRGDRRFDAEDARVLETIARFASAAYAALERIGIVQSLRAERLAALNLMEDAIAARQETERVAGMLHASRRRQAFLLLLADALRPLSDPARIQAEAMRMLEEHLGALRAEYWDAAGSAENEEEPVGGSAAARGPGFISVPLVKEGRTVVVLGLYHATRRQWTPEEVALAEETVERTWAAVDRARSQAELAQSEEKYRTLFESIDEGVATVEVLFDRDGKAVDYLILEINSAYEANSGLGPEVVGKRVRQILPTIEASLIERMGHVALTGEHIRFEEFLHGLNRYFDIYLSRVGGNGSHTVASVFKDVTERKRREANLAFLAEVSQDLVRQTNVDEAMPALGGKIAAHFSAALCTLGEADEAGETVSVRHEWHRPDAPNLTGTHRWRDFFGEDFQRASRSDEVFIVADTASDPRTIAGRFSAVKVRSLVSVPLAREGKGHFLLTVADTAPREWRKEEIELMQELTVRVWTRLERARAEEELRDADERKNHFLALLGHELRNPLAAIRGGVALLRSEKTKPATRAATLPIVAEQVAHMERLIDDLLDVTRIVRGQLQIRLEPVILQDTLKHAVDMIRSRAEAAQFEVQVDMPPEPLAVHADSVRLTQVFVNLLTNALNYSGEARRVDVSVVLKDATALVSVRDYGPGISPELLPRIFEPFVQGRPALTLEGGLGLGLAVVRELVAQHGGKVEVLTGGERIGSEFSIQLPLASTVA